MTDEEFLPIIFKNIDELRFRLVRILEVFGFFFIFFLIFSITRVTLFGVSFPFITFNVYHNIPAQFLKLLEAHIIPSGTQLLVLKPTDGVSANIYTALFLSLIFAMPNIVYQIGKFIGPALKKSEKELIRVITVPASLLFTAGAFMGLWFVAPELFTIFHNFNIGLGAESTMGVMSFVSFLLLYVVSFGVAFEIPVFMYGLTRSGMVQAETWYKYWRYAIVGSLIFGMIFSPGVLGFTMMVMSLPMIALYFAGAYFAMRYQKKYGQKESNTVTEAL